MRTSPSRSGAPTTSTSATPPAGPTPLPNPLQVTIDETLCSSVTPGVTSVSPGNNLTIPDSTPVLHANFDLPIDPTRGVITLTGDMGTNLSYDLATAPGAITIIDDNRTLVIDPGIVFPIGETVTVTWTGLYDITCRLPVAPPSWAFTLGGPPYVIAPGSTAYADACIGGTQLAITTAGRRPNRAIRAACRLPVLRAAGDPGPGLDQRLAVDRSLADECRLQQ